MAPASAGMGRARNPANNKVVAVRRPENMQFPLFLTPLRRRARNIIALYGSNMVNFPFAKHSGMSDEKKAAPKDGLESFRRGCLKGPFLLRCDAFFRNCERQVYGCVCCNCQQLEGFRSGNVEGVRGSFMNDRSGAAAQP